MARRLKFTTNEVVSIQTMDERRRSRDEENAANLKSLLEACDRCAPYDPTAPPWDGAKSILSKPLHFPLALHMRGCYDRYNNKEVRRTA